LNGAYRRVLIHDNLEEPRDVAVAPTLGWMFWSDWGKKPKIERASLDGTERVVLVSDDLGWPNGIALDVEMKKIVSRRGGKWIFHQFLILSLP
jgi:low density lipoprotein receptor-related protein 5/6